MVAAVVAMAGERRCGAHCPIQATRARLSRPTSGYHRVAATAVVAAVAAAPVARPEASWLAAAAVRAALREWLTEDLRFRFCGA